MMGFAIPADFRPETIAALAQANATLNLPVREVYMFRPRGGKRLVARRRGARVMR